MSKNKVTVIAEIGVNHNGKMHLAKKLINIAKEAGADYVKFQTFKVENLVTFNAPKAQYQKKFDKNLTQYSMLKKLEFNLTQFAEIKQYCSSKKIKFISSPFDLQSIDFLKKLGIKIIKIPSGEITNLPYLQSIGKLNLPTILSTGISDLIEIRNAINILKYSGLNIKNKLSLLHCTSSYPTKINEVNLLAIKTLKKKFNLPVGYSDHTNGTEISIAAAAIGATIIEKHLTISRNMKGPDHKSSLEPNEFIEMCKSIKNVSKSMGNGIKQPMKSEIRNKIIVRKSIVASRSIKKGEKFSTKNITIKRPGDGISPMEYYKILGSLSKKNYKKDEKIKK